MKNPNTKIISVEGIEPWQRRLVTDVETRMVTAGDANFDVCPKLVKIGTKSAKMRS